MWETSFRQLSRVAQPGHLFPQTLRTLGEAETKSGHQRELAALELLNTLFRNFHHTVSTGPSGRSPGGQSAQSEQRLGGRWDIWRRVWMPG